MSVRGALSTEVFDELYAECEVFISSRLLLLGSRLARHNRVGRDRRLSTAASLAEHERCLDWVNQHKALTLLGSEACNYGIHGVSNPLGVTFAMGGTLANALVVLLLIPARTRIRSLLSKRSLTR